MENGTFRIVDARKEHHAKLYVYDHTVALVMSSNLTYKRTQNLTDADVQTFIVSSYTTQKKRLAKWGYEPTGIPGVYHNPFWIMQGVKIIFLNELTAEPHNAFIKCFASRQSEQQKAFAAAYEVLKSRETEERLMGRKPQDVLGRFNPDEIRAYLKQLEERQQ